VELSMEKFGFSKGKNFRMELQNHIAPAQVPPSSSTAAFRHSTASTSSVTQALATIHVQNWQTTRGIEPPRRKLAGL
jgi:DNA-binding MurR/RpiR family transcriptional regulator